MSEQGHSDYDFDDEDYAGNYYYSSDESSQGDEPPPSETESEIHAPEPANPYGPPSPEPENIPIPATPLEEIELIDWWHSDEQWSTPYDNHPEDYHSSVSSAPSDYFDYYQAERDDEEFREANEQFVRNELSRIAYERIRNLSNSLLLRHPPLDPALSLTSPSSLPEDRS